MTALQGYSPTYTDIDTAGNVQAGKVLNVTGPSSYSGTVTTSSLGAYRLGPLPLGDYTVTDPLTSRSEVVTVYPIGSDLQAVANLAAAAQPGDPDLTALAGLDSAQAGMVASDGAGWIRKTYAQVKTALGLAKADVGLGNVDNTADTAKPVSTAQQTALDLKANLASPALTGVPTAPTAAQGTNTTQLATTAFARAEIAALVNSAPGTLDTLGEIAAQLAADESAATALTTAVGIRGIVVDHGATAGTARPSSALPVMWKGTVAPTNAVTNDEWYDRTAELLKRYNGPAWVGSGSATYVTVVEHGATAGTARPAGAVRVFWRGSVQPTNATTYDRWLDTSTTPYTERVYNGSAFTLFAVTASSYQFSSITAATGTTYGAGVPGLVSGSNRSGATSGIIVGRIIWVPFTTLATITVTEAMIRVTSAATAGGTWLAAIYNANSSGQPTSRVANLTPTPLATDSTGVKKSTGLSVSLSAGNYFLASLALTSLPGLLLTDARPVGVIVDGSSTLLDQAALFSNGQAYTSLSDPAPADMTYQNINLCLPIYTYLRWS
jgi:hypothetical protein